MSEQGQSTLNSQSLSDNQHIAPCCPRTTWARLVLKEHSILCFRVSSSHSGTAALTLPPVTFWTIYAVLHLRAQKMPHGSWCTDVTECFYSTPGKRAPWFWHTGKCRARERSRRRCHPSLTSVCFHLSTTVLIDKTSFPDVIPSRAHMLTSLRHHCWLPAEQSCKTKIFKLWATQHNFECHTGSYFRIN